MRRRRRKRRRRRRKMVSIPSPFNFRSNEDKEKNGSFFLGVHLIGFFRRMWCGLLGIFFNLFSRLGSPDWKVNTPKARADYISTGERPTLIMNPSVTIHIYCCTVWQDKLFKVKTCMSASAFGVLCYSRPAGCRRLTRKLSSSWSLTNENIDRLFFFFFW